MVRLPNGNRAARPCHPLQLVGHISKLPTPSPGQKVANSAEPAFKFEIGAAARIDKSGSSKGGDAGVANPVSQVVAETTSSLASQAKNSGR